MPPGINFDTKAFQWPAWATPEGKALVAILDRNNSGINDSSRNDSNMGHPSSISVMDTTYTNECLIRKIKTRREKWLGHMSQQIAALEEQFTLYGSNMVVEVPPKVLRPRVVIKYIPPDYTDNIHEGIFDFAQYGKALYKPRKMGRSQENLHSHFFLCKHR